MIQHKQTPNNPTALLAHQLAQTESPELVRTLTEVAIRVQDETVCSAVMEAIRPLADQRCIDEICRVWQRTRHPELGQLVAQAGWVASTPDRLRLLTALKSDRLELLEQGGAEVVLPLLEACEDADTGIACNARLVLEQLQNPEARAELYRLVIETDHPLAQAVVVSAGYTPADPQQRALIYVLTGQWKKYEALDFDQSLIQAVYQVSNEWLQSRLADLTRQAGRAEFVQIIAGGRQQRRLTDMTEGEWEVVLALLTNRQQWPQMWQLAQAAPPVWSQQLLRQLAEAGWQPDRPDDRTGFDELIELARMCQAEGLQLGNLIRCQETMAEHAGSVNDLAISPDGQLLVSGSDDQTVRLWSLPNGKLLKTLDKHTSEIWSVAISPDGRLLASGGDDGLIHLWRLPDGKFLSTLDNHAESVNDLAISPVPLEGQSSQWLLAAGSSSGNVRLWRLPDGKALKTLSGHRDVVVNLAISPDGQLLASGSRDTTIRLWRLPDGGLQQTLQGHIASVNGLAISSNGRLLGSGSLDQTVRIWLLPGGEPFKTLRGHTDAIADLAIQPAGEPLMASGSLDRMIRLWRMSDGALTATLEGHSNWVMALAIDPNGRLLASGSYDHTIKLWSSDLTRLAYVPVTQTTMVDVDWLQETIRQGKVSADERTWAAFMLALNRWRRRFDVEVEEVTRQVTVGEFDIELEFVG